MQNPLSMPPPRNSVHDNHKNEVALSQPAALLQHVLASMEKSMEKVRINLHQCRYVYHQIRALCNTLLKLSDPTPTTEIMTVIRSSLFLLELMSDPNHVVVSPGSSNPSAAEQRNDDPRVFSDEPSRMGIEELGVGASACRVPVANSDFFDFVCPKATLEGGDVASADESVWQWLLLDHFTCPSLFQLWKERLTHAWPLHSPLKTDAELLLMRERDAVENAAAVVQWITASMPLPTPQFEGAACPSSPCDALSVEEVLSLLQRRHRRYVYRSTTSKPSPPSRLVTTVTVEPSPGGKKALSREEQEAAVQSSDSGPIAGLHLYTPPSALNGALTETIGRFYREKLCHGGWRVLYEDLDRLMVLPCADSRRQRVGAADDDHNDVEENGRKARPEMEATALGNDGSSKRTVVGGQREEEEEMLADAGRVDRLARSRRRWFGLSHPGQGPGSSTSKSDADEWEAGEEMEHAVEAVLGWDTHTKLGAVATRVPTRPFPSLAPAEAPSLASAEGHLSCAPSAEVAPHFILRQGFFWHGMPVTLQELDSAVWGEALLDRTETVTAFLQDAVVRCQWVYPGLLRYWGGFTEKLCSEEEERAAQHIALRRHFEREEKERTCNEPYHHDPELPEQTAPLSPPTTLLFPVAFPLQSDALERWDGTSDNPSHPDDGQQQQQRQQVQGSNAPTNHLPRLCLGLLREDVFPSVSTLWGQCHGNAVSDRYVSLHHCLYIQRRRFTPSEVVDIMLQVLGIVQYLEQDRLKVPPEVWLSWISMSPAAFYLCQSSEVSFRPSYQASSPTLFSMNSGYPHSDAVDNGRRSQTSALMIKYAPPCYVQGGSLSRWRPHPRARSPTCYAMAQLFLAIQTRRLPYERGWQYNRDLLAEADKADVEEEEESGCAVKEGILPGMVIDSHLAPAGKSLCRRALSLHKRDPPMSLEEWRLGLLRWEEAELS